MAASGLGSDEGLTSINITPMVDIILVLLVIFMVTTTTIHKLEGLEVDRPDAATGAQVESNEDGQILLTCQTGGEVWIDGEKSSSDEQIVAAIRAKKERNPAVQGVISCDEEADVRTLVHLLDLLRAEGVKKYAIATEPPESQPAG